MDRFKLWLLIGAITLAVRTAMAVEEAYEFGNPTDPSSR